MPDPEDTSAPQDWLEAELADTLDEELELSEPALPRELHDLLRRTRPPSLHAGTTFEPCWHSRPS
jgi:hypothetical protein